MTGSVKSSILPSGIALIQLGAPEERVVTLTPTRLNSLRTALAELRNESVKGLIIVGSHASMFTAGADINLIRDVTDPDIGEKLAREGQHVFSQIESLPFPTVAAISGPCVGGGCELALACTFRVITRDRASSIGLPEIKLGIIPGFGGTQRLPKLIGLPKALEIILGGKILKPDRALQVGLVDKIVEGPEQLLDVSEKLIELKSRAHLSKISFVDKLLTSTAIGRRIVKGQSLKAIYKESKGFYPAPVRALDACIAAFSHGGNQGYQFEAQQLGRMIVTPESKALVNLFFLTESAKAVGKTARTALESASVGIIGAGVMGAGIAAVTVKAGLKVTLKDTADEALERGKGHVRKILDTSRSLSLTEKEQILQRLNVSKDTSSLNESTIVIEAVPEKLALKHAVLGELAAGVSPNTIIASNTSSLPISDIAAPIARPERVVGMHFFNPVEKMPLVEIVRGSSTSDETIAQIAALTVRLGKYPIVVNDVPGFLVNRILTPYLMEAAHLLAEGCTVEAIDAAALAFGMPMGPIRLLDEVGLDVAAHVSAILEQAYGERMKGPPFAAKLVERKEYGKKSGLGFYHFDGERASSRGDIRNVLGIEGAAKVYPKETLINRLMLPLIQEAVRCLDEGVAGQPGRAAADQIDLGSVMGFGFPPFRGGILRYAESIGAQKLLISLQVLQKEYGVRFAPAEGVVRRAERNASFYQA
jgi:3-hydroxyacyl-CoA dehydrogenase/enoyl-CoA hydratase/3-hydroxybutyryl-CoA epimerase